MVNELGSLGEHRDLHAVTAEILSAAKDVSLEQKVQLSIAIRHTQSARGAAERYSDAILKYCLPDALMEKLPFPNGAPYRNVMSRAEVAAQVEQAASDNMAVAPFPNIQSARDFLKTRLLAHGPKNAPDRQRQSQFHSAEVAKEMLSMQASLVLDGSTCPLETGALFEQRCARKFFPCGHCEQDAFASAVSTNGSRPEILWCEYDKYIDACSFGVTKPYTLPVGFRRLAHKKVLAR